METGSGAEWPPLTGVPLLIGAFADTGTIGIIVAVSAVVLNMAWIAWRFLDRLPKTREALDLWLASLIPRERN